MFCEKEIRRRNKTCLSGAKCANVVDLKKNAPKSELIFTCKIVFDTAENDPSNFKILMF